MAFDLDHIFKYHAPTPEAPMKRKPKPKRKPPVCDIHTFVTVAICGCTYR